jgi:hypothetical protein
MLRRGGEATDFLKAAAKLRLPAGLVHSSRFVPQTCTIRLGSALQHIRGEKGGANPQEVAIVVLVDELRRVVREKFCQRLRTDHQWPTLRSHGF